MVVFFLNIVISINLLKQKQMKTIALIITVIGCGFHVYSQNSQFSKEDLSIIAQVERQKIVHHFADSCLRYAKSLESKGLLYKPKDYFTAVRSIDSLVKIYNVAPPVHVVSDLKLIMCRGSRFVPDNLKDEVSRECAKAKKPISLPSVEDIADIFGAFCFIAFSVIFVWLTMNRNFVVGLFMQLIRSIKFSREKNYLVINLIALKARFHYLIRPPTKFTQTIEHIPLFIGSSHENYH